MPFRRFHVINLKHDIAAYRSPFSYVCTERIYFDTIRIPIYQQEQKCTSRSQNSRTPWFSKHWIFSFLRHRQPSRYFFRNGQSHPIRASERAPLHRRSLSLPLVIQSDNQEYHTICPISHQVLWGKFTWYLVSQMGLNTSFDKFHITMRTKTLNSEGECHSYCDLRIIFSQGH